MGQIISYFSHATLLTALLMLCACATGAAPRKDAVVGAQEVRGTEIAFAKAMADRDFGAFVSHLSGDAVFFDENEIQRGVAAVSEQSAACVSRREHGNVSSVWRVLN
jgi:hypothetical protein